MDIRCGAIQFFIVSVAFLAIGISIILNNVYSIGSGCMAIAAFYLLLGIVKLLK